MSNKRVKYPRVLLVGRTNVGKSTLFNRIVGKASSIVFSREGVTRDYVEQLIVWQGKTFCLVDTGGMALEKGRKIDDFVPFVQEQVMQQMEKSALLLFVCDGKNGLTMHDMRIAKMLHKSKRPVMLLISKADNTNALADHLPEFYKLGFSSSSIFPVSAIHGTGIADVLDATAQQIPHVQVDKEPEPSFNVAIVGKPNVGKSSLMNLLIKQQRSIVSDIAGTTRDAISENMFHTNELIKVTDTAGVRRKRRVTDDLEGLMVKNVFQSIKDASIVLLMIDASQGKVADQELKLLFYIFKEKKPVVMILNKVDLLDQDPDDYKREMLLQSMDEYDFILKKIPQIAVSCVTEKNIGKIVNQVRKVLGRCRQQFHPAKLDETVKDVLAKKGLFHKTSRLKLFKIRQIDAKIPTFVMHVNNVEWWGESQKGFIENILRKNYDLKGCPIQFSLRKI